MISIDWATRVITVPKADTVQIQAAPEVRTYNVNTFRQELKDLEDDPDGMPFPDTHSHVTEITISGVTYTRFVEIINGYTVEFEDGQYTVVTTDANHNIGDVKVANQVSLTTNNSAGLVKGTASDDVWGHSKALSVSKFLGLK